MSSSSVNFSGGGDDTNRNSISETERVQEQEQEPDWSQNPLPEEFSSFVPIDRPNPIILSATFRQSGDTIGFRPYPFLLRYIWTLMNNEVRSISTNIRFEDGRLISLRLRRILDHYVDDILQHQEPTRSSSSPASQSAINELPTTRVSEDMANSELNLCAVCIETFKVGDKMTELPCKHYYHKRCVLKWLAQHNNSCPVCRKAVPANIDGEDSTTGAMQGSSGGDAGSNGGELDEGNWRLYRISLVFRFRLSEDEDTAQENSNRHRG